MSAALGAAGQEGEEETFEDRINRVMESRKLLPNASCFAFTATPKNKTLQQLKKHRGRAAFRGEEERRARPVADLRKARIVERETRRPRHPHRAPSIPTARD